MISTAHSHSLSDHDQVMIPPSGCPDAFRSAAPPSLPATPLLPSAAPSTARSPLPVFPTRLSSKAKNIEVQLPPLIAGALIAAFAKALVDGLGDGNDVLLAHYYFPDDQQQQRVRVNLDRVVDRLLSAFTRRLWDELFRFYHAADESAETLRQVALLFDGPIRQLVLVLNGPETAKCVLDRLGPGLSTRKATWSTSAGGIDLALALQLVCSFWHREYPDASPSGTPEEIARALHSLIINGDAARDLVVEVRRMLVAPHHVQMHLAESAIWEMIVKRRSRPPPDGFQVAQITFECSLFGAQDGIGDPQLVSLSNLPAITGTADQCVQSTVSEYVDAVWPKCGRIVLSCLEDAVRLAAAESAGGNAGCGMSVWDGAAEGSPPCPSLRLLHVEVESTAVRLSVSAWTHTLIDIFQQMSWMCAALSASPFQGQLSECTADVSNWTHVDNAFYVDCTMMHRPIPEGDGCAWLRQIRGAAIARGFPIDIQRDAP